MSLHADAGQEERTEPGIEQAINGDPSWSFEGKFSSEDPEQSGEPQAETDIPPDGGYGWVCVGCAFLIVSLNRRRIQRLLDHALQHVSRRLAHSPPGTVKGYMLTSRHYE